MIITGCKNKDCDISYQVYQFEISATLSPVRETYKIGDTISINSRFSDQVYEAKTDQYYLLENFNFYPAMIISEISNEEQDRSALNNFEFIVDTTRYDFEKYTFSSTGGVSYKGQFNYFDNQYSLEYQFIPNTPGLYIFTQDNLIGFLDEHRDFPGKCENTAINVWTILNERADNNIELGKDSPIWFYNTKIYTDPDARYNNIASFIFYVEE